MAENYLETFNSYIEKIKKEREEKVKKGEIIQPLDVPQIDVLPSDPDPDVDDNKQMKQLNDRWARDAKRRFPDDETKQKEFIESQRKKTEIQKEYLTQVVGGVFDAGNSALNFTVNRFMDEDSKILLPEIEAPKSTPQALVRGGAQFMIPYLGWFKMIKGATIGAKLIKAKKGSRLSFKQDLAIATGAGVMADVVHFEANDPTLSNLIETYPHLSNPITKYLQTDPDDPEALNRFKRAIEGAGLGNFLAVILRGMGHGFTKVGENVTEKVVRHAIDKRTRPLASVKNKKGQPVKGRWQARVNGKTINVTRRKTGYEVEVDGVRYGTYKTLKELKKDIKNVEMHSMNVEEGLKGSDKLPVDEKNTFTKFMNIDRRASGQRIKDWWNGWQIRSWLAIKGFDQYHGIKLVNKALKEQKLDKGGFEDLRMYKEARLLAAISGSLEHLIHNGTFRRIGDGNLEKVGKSLKEILKPLEKDIDDWLNYVVAKRLTSLKRYDPDSKKWIKDKKKFNDIFPNKEDRKLVVNQSRKGNTVTADGKTYDDVLKEFDQFNKEVLDFAEQSGILSKDHRHTIEQSPHYISLYRDFKGTDFEFTKFSRGAGNGLVKKLRGAPVVEAGESATAKGHMWDEAKQKIVKTKQDVYPFRDFLEGYLENIFGIVKASHRNHVNATMGRALQRFVDDMEKDLLATGLSKADAKAQAVRDIGRLWGKKTSAFRLDKGTVDASSRNIREQLEDMNIDLKDANLDDLVFYAPSRIKLQDNQFLFSKNVGNSRELEMWEISNPFLAESMMAVGDRLVRHQSKALNFARGFKTLLTRGVTYDPGFFAYANLIRDSLSSSILSRDGFFGIGGGTIPILSTFKGYVRQWTPNSVVMGKNGKSLKNFDGSDMTYRDLWSEFTLNGGGFDSTLMRSSLHENRLKSIYEKMGLDYKFVVNRSKFMQGAPVKGVKKAINGIDDAVGMFEYASRFAEYHRLRSRGVGAREASYQAREIATDFAMHGSGSMLHFFTQTVPFLNAGLQGLYRTLRAGEGLTGSQRAYMAAKISTAILLPTFFFRWINRDNPEYKKLTQHTRDMHWIIPKEGGGHYLIPKPFEWGALSTLVDRAWDTWGAEEIINPLTNERIRWAESDKYFTGADFAEVATKVMSEQMRLNIMPQVFVPYSSLATNTRFTGSPIVPSFMRSYLPETEQAYPWSNAAILSAFRKYPEWAQWTGLSPIAIEHILKTYTGTVGAFAMDFIVDPAFREDGIDWGTGIPAKPEIDIPVFGTWDEVPLVKRFFLGKTPRHTKALIESYKLKNEVTKRMNELNKLEKEGLFDEYMKRINKPEWQDIIALDKGLSGQFAKMEQLSQSEKQLFQKGFPGNAKERGRLLEGIRQQKIQLTEELIGMLEGYNLDYIIPREITLPFSGSRFQLPKYPKGQDISVGGTITTSPSQTFSGSLNELFFGN